MELLTNLGWDIWYFVLYGGYFLLDARTVQRRHLKPLESTSQSIGQGA